MNPKSNTGEGREDPARFAFLGPNGEQKSSTIKHVASGGFGVTSEYLCNPDEIQIKLDEGGRLLGHSHAATGLHLAVRLQQHARVEVVEHQRLLHLGDAQYTRQATAVEVVQAATPVLPSSPLTSMWSACLGHASRDMLTLTSGTSLNFLRGRTCCVRRCME